MTDISVAIVGAGAIGQAYAAGLAAGGARVTLVARGPSLDELTRAGAIRTGGVFQRHVRLASERDAPTAVRLAEAVGSSVNGVIFATKGYDLRRSAETLEHVDAQWVMGLQNGVAKDDILAEVFGHGRVLGEVGMLAAELGDGGEVRVTNLGVTFIGELSGGASERAPSISAALSRGGIPAEVSADVRSAEWSKLVNVAGTFGVDLLARSTWSRSMEDRHLGRAFLALLREAALVARAEGVEIRDLPGIPSATYLGQSDEESLELRAVRAQKVRQVGGELGRRSSLLQDLLKGRPLEADFIFDDLVSRGKRHGIATPRLELVRDIARGLDATRPSGQSAG